MLSRVVLCSIPERPEGILEADVLPGMSGRLEITGVRIEAIILLPFLVIGEDLPNGLRNVLHFVVVHSRVQ